MRSTPLVAIALLAIAGCHPTPRPPQLGITAEVTLTDRSRHQGELLAVHRDSLVLMIGDSLRWLPLSAVTRAVIDRRVRGVGPSVRGMVGVGAVTGLALMIACSSADADNCVEVLPVAVAAAVMVGFLGGIETSRFRYATFEPPTAEQLRPWARYPQGMPEGFGGGPPE